MARTTETFSQTISGRMLKRFAGQRWRRDDGAEFTGEQFGKRMWEIGFILSADDVHYLTTTPVGGAFKTGVSGYERTQ